MHPANDAAVAADALAAVASRHVAQSAASPISRREWMLWIVGAILANEALHIIDVSSVGAFFGSVLSINIFVLFAGFVVVRRLQLSDPAVNASPLDLAIGLGLLAILCVSGLAGYRADIGLAASVAAFYLLIGYGSTSALRAAGATLLALAVNLVWAPMAAQVVMPELLWLDTMVVKATMSLAQIPYVQKGTAFLMPGDHALTLVAACSSFSNMSMAVLGSVSAIMALRPTFVRRDVVVMIIACVAMVLVNAARITVYALGREQHAYWHDGAGAQVIGLMITGFVMVTSFIGALWASRDLDPVL